MIGNKLLERLAGRGACNFREPALDARARLVLSEQSRRRGDALRERTFHIGCQLIHTPTVIPFHAERSEELGINNHRGGPRFSDFAASRGW